MAHTGKGQKALDRAHKFREDIERLLATTPGWALRGWFQDWAEGQLRHNRFYLYSDKEHAVLAKELSSRMTPCDGWGGYAVDQLVRAALAYRADCSEEDDELLTILQREKPSELPLWLMLRWSEFAGMSPGCRSPIPIWRPLLARQIANSFSTLPRVESAAGTFPSTQHLAHAPQSVNKTFRNRGALPLRSISGWTVPRIELIRGRLSQRPRS
jgi:hypothetical protein